MSTERAISISEDPAGYSSDDLTDALNALMEDRFEQGADIFNMLHDEELSAIENTLLGRAR